MSTKMTEEDWKNALVVFRACLPRRGAKGRDDLLFLQALHYFAVHNISWRAQRLETVRPAEQGRCVRRLLRASRGAFTLGPSGSDVRFDRRSRPCLGGWSKGGQENQALGRSRGGFSTKIHLKTDYDGRPIAFHMTGGEKADAPHMPVLLDLGPEVAPRAVMGDKGYDSKANRAAARARGAVPVIPYKSNARNKPKFFPKILYEGRARIEQAVGKIKRFKRIALRCEKTERNFLSFIHITAALVLIQSVHTA